MITLKSAREIEAMDKAGDFLASIHIGLRDLIKPGVDMWEVEEYVRRRCKEENFLPLQIGVDGAMMDYPYATCCSLNDEVAHAFPRHYILKDGDLLKVDMVLGGPIAKSDLNVSKLNFNNVEQMKKLHSELFWWFSRLMLGLCCWYTVRRSQKLDGYNQRSYVQGY